MNETDDKAIEKGIEADVASRQAWEDQLKKGCAALGLAENTFAACEQRAQNANQGDDLLDAEWGHRVAITPPELCAPPELCELDLEAITRELIAENPAQARDDQQSPLLPDLFCGGPISISAEPETDYTSITRDIARGT